MRNSIGTKKYNEEELAKIFNAIIWEAFWHEIPERFDRKMLDMYNAKYSRDEQIPWNLLKTAKPSKNGAVAYYLNEWVPEGQSNKCVGWFCYVSPDDNTALFPYFCMDQNILAKTLPQWLLTWENVILPVKPDTQEYNYLLQNGLYKTGTNLITKNDTKYEFLSSIKDYKLTKQYLLELFANMNKDPFVKTKLKTFAKTNFQDIDEGL